MKLPSGSKAGATNLTCPHCQHRYDILEIELLDPTNMSPDTYSICGKCNSWFFPDNAVLETYHNLDEDSGYLTAPLSAGAGELENTTRTCVGEERTHRMHNLFDGYVFHIVRLQNVHRKGVNKGNQLDIDLLGDTYSRVELGQAVVVSVDINNEQELSITANIREDAPSGVNVNSGDEISVYYVVSVNLDSVRDPPWIDLLRECKRAVSQDNFISAIPLLKSSLDNALYRQIYTYYRWQENGSNEAHQKIREEFGNKNGELYTKDLAKDAFKQISGTSLCAAKGPYGDEWNRFWGEGGVRSARNDIIHPDGGSLDHIGRNKIVEWFNLTMNLILGSYDLLREQRYQTS